MTSAIVILPAGEAFLVDQASALSLVNAWIQAELSASLPLWDRGRLWDWDAERIVP